MNANQIFKDDFGVETWENLAQLSAWWYFKDGDTFPYEKERGSTAFILWKREISTTIVQFLVAQLRRFLNLIRECPEELFQDIENQLSSTYEHHLNKYLFIKKPTKLLSPEYNWDQFKNPSAN